MDVGDYVIDAEVDDDAPRAVVILTPNMTIADWEVDDEATVADMNPEYDEDDSVVIVAYVEDLDEWWEGWSEVDPTELFDEIADRGHKFYAFPGSRLDVVDEDYGKDPLQIISESLEDHGYEDIERENDVLVLEKFGEYRIHPDGSVDGDGTIQEQLERIVESAIA